MASSAAAVLSRSIQHLLRRHVATAPALSAVAGKSIIGRPVRVNPTAEDPDSAGGAANVGVSCRSFDMALFGRVDWPAMPSSEQVKMLAKNSDDDEDGFVDDFDSDEFDDGEEFSDSSDDDSDDVDDEDVEDTKPTKSVRR